ncbi:MAG: hypothetical protein KGI70_01465 [Patescibacteria group bacterium]|nr:hypothetical protein [Patescibacteria group bacterium]
MADEKDEGTHPFTHFLWVLGAFAALVVLWLYAGGPGKADLRGLFLAPPPPVGSGGAYGPQLGTTTDYSNQ